MKRCLCLLILVLSCACLSLLWGQGGGGSITGTVSDPSSALIGEATVEINNVATGVVQKTTTTSSGQFVFPVVPTGTYRVTVSAPGFVHSVLTGVTVNLNQPTTLAVTMQVGAVTQSVEVSATAVQLQSETAQQSTNISNTTYEALPMAVNGDSRQPTAFLFLVPGVNSPANAQTATNQTFSTSINGGQSFSSEVLLDGASTASTNVAGDYRNLQFPVDIVDQFTLVASNFTADQGRAAGGIISYTTKSGTNDLHGGAYEYLRNDKLDARGFFTPTRAITRQNEFGFNLGGPVFIPKLYNGKNRTFFFGWYSGFRNRRGASNSLGTAPTEAQRNGDFSAYPQPIYDPLTNAPDGNGGVTRTQFPGNVIPSNRITEIARNFNKFLPATNGQLVNNVASSQGQSNDVDREGAKIDHSFSDSHRINGLLSISRSTNTSPQFGDVYSGPLSTTLFQTQNVYYGRLNYTAMIRPNLVNQATVGFNRNYNPFGYAGIGTNFAADLGIQGLLTAGENVPNFSFTGYTNAGGGSGQIVVENSWVFNDFISWNKGRHTLKFGVDFRRQGDNTNTLAGSGFGFSNLQTSLPNSPNRDSTGNGYASFLIGAVNTASLDLYVNTTDNRFQYFAGYVMDDWKVTDKLTLNLGIRYDIPWTRRERLGRMSTFDPSVPNPGAAGRMGAIIFAGEGAGRTGKNYFSDTDFKLVQPRFGFAYQFTPKTVVRGGYSIFAGTSGDVLENGIRQNYGNGFNAFDRRNSTDNGLTPAFYLQDGYPAFPLPPFIDPTLNLGQSVAWDAREDGHTARLQNWSVDVQRQLPGETLLELAYVANHGSHLSTNILNFNQVDPKRLSLGNALTAQLSSPEGQATGVPLPYPGFTGTVAQALRPYPQYQSLSRLNGAAGSSTYHSFQASLRRRFSQGFSLMVSYTWSKWLTDSESGHSWYDRGGMDQYNHGLEKSLSTSDIPQNLTLSYVYELPVGKNKPLKTSGVANTVLGGWQISGTHRYQSGYPLGVGVNNTLPIFSGQRPVCIAGANPRGAWTGDPATSVYLNRDAFAVPAPFTFGTCGPTVPGLRGRPFFNEDFALSKHFRFRERLDAEFRFEAFNAFNRVVFSNPNTNLSSVGFGTISGQTNIPRMAQGGIHLRF
jgi:outer membrane receptor protein involved in Fe transport